MVLTPMKPMRQYRVSVGKFLGLDARERCENGAFINMQNLCGDGFPTLCVRPRRGRVADVTAGCAMTAKDALCWVDGTTLYVNGEATDLVLSQGEKQLVSMGAYLLIWPDKKYVNTRALSDCGSLESSVSVTGAVTVSLCDGRGSDYEAYATGTTAPAQAESGALWLDTADKCLRRYDGAVWQEVAEVYVKVACPGIGAGFREGDGVEISGLAALTGEHIVKLQSTNALALTGSWDSLGTELTEVTVSRFVPDMDFVVECGNRLWGCKYGMVNGRAVNEIYASALGDFRNWRTFAGLSTDAYAAQRGSDGPFTGAVSFLGNPLFFKENGLEKVYPAASGAHQIVYTPCPGVARGSSGSLQVVDSSLYYLGIGGVYRYDGAMPVKVSDALGAARYHDGVAGGDEGHYYLSALDGDDDAHLLVYDTARKLWHRQDDLRALAFAALDGEVYALTATAIWALKGTDGVVEEDIVPWMAESGEWGLDSPERKYLQRLDIRLKPVDSHIVTARVSYDEGATWELAGDVLGRGDARACRMDLKLRRCTQVRLKLEGCGSCTIYGIDVIYNKGSDVE